MYFLVIVYDEKIKKAKEVSENFVKNIKHKECEESQ